MGVPNAPNRVRWLGVPLPAAASHWSCFGANGELFQAFSSLKLPLKLLLKLPLRLPLLLHPNSQNVIRAEEVLGLEVHIFPGFHTSCPNIKLPSLFRFLLRCLERESSEKKRNCITEYTYNCHHELSGRRRQLSRPRQLPGRRHLSGPGPRQLPRRPRQLSEPGPRQLSGRGPR